jgi:ribosomal protein S18 acetylase RimI-like enzyme
VAERLFVSSYCRRVFLAVHLPTQKIVGCVTSRERWGMGETAWVAIHPEHRHAGVGYMLIRASTQYLSSQYERLTGVMRPVQPKVRAFWELHGFEVKQCPA